MSDNGLLKISELAGASGVPVATVRHYLREGLLPEPVKTSRNMAYYPPEFVDRIRLIKQLQEERFMPLRVIRDLLEREDAEPERVELRARFSADTTPSEVQEMLDGAISVPTRYAPHISLEELDRDEVVVRIVATPTRPADGAKLAGEILAAVRQTDGTKSRSGG